MGIIFGMLLASLFFSVEIMNGIEAKDALSECEKNLPRSQHCVIAAEPVKEEKSNEQQ